MIRSTETPRLLRAMKKGSLRSQVYIITKRSQCTQNLHYGLEKKWAYYNQQAIDHEASKPLYKLTPFQLMSPTKYINNADLLKSSQYLQKELPKRIARRVKDFQSLPYVVLINPTMQEIYELYLRAFHKLSSFPTIVTLEDERTYSSMIQKLLNDHKDVVTALARAFHETKEVVEYDVLGHLTERTLTSRLGIRLLAEHHLASRNSKANFVGVISLGMSPKKLIEKCVFSCKAMCEHRYGLSPAVFVDGHTKAKFPHIPAPIEYIVQELIKNSMKATVLKYKNKPTDMPPVQVTVCNNDTDIMLKISDRGGGIPESRLVDIFKYSFSTTDEDDYKHSNGAFDGMLRTANAYGSDAAGTISGYGFGLPSSLAYAKFLGGTLNVIPMYGLGTDAFLKLSHINKPNCFRI